MAMLASKRSESFSLLLNAYNQFLMHKCNFTTGKEEITLFCVYIEWDVSVLVASLHMQTSLDLLVYQW